MTRITCQVADIYLPGDHVDEIPSVEATCTACQHAVGSYGDGPDSVRRCLVVMREECPRGQRNYYVSDRD